MRIVLLAGTPNNGQSTCPPCLPLSFFEKQTRPASLAAPKFFQKKMPQFADFRGQKTAPTGSSNKVLFMKHGFLFSLFCALPFFLFSQTPTKPAPATAGATGAVSTGPAPKFPENPAEFLPKLAEFVTVSKRPDLEEAMKVFEKTWKYGTFKPSEQTRIITQANRMGELKMAAFPFFMNYLNALSDLKTNADTLLFEKWHPLVEATMTDLERGKNKPMETFLIFSADFFKQRALSIGEGGNVTWQAVGGTEEFGYLEKKPFVRLDRVRLDGIRKKDTIAIERTTGVYYPVEKLWKATTGRVSWKRTGLDSTVYAQLGAYEINATTAGYSTTDVKFYYPLYFPGQILTGKFEDKVFVGGASSEVSYPRFESDVKRLNIQNIGEGISMTGGFRIEGSSVYGFGERREKAQMWMYQSKSADRPLLFHGAAEIFSIKRGEKVFGEKVTAAIFPGAGTDSLFHPAIGFQVDLKKQNVQLYRGKASDERTPFFSSSNNMNLDIERISWFIVPDSLVIGARAAGLSGSAERGTFESKDYFNEREYARLQNTASYNPIASIYSMWVSNGEERFIDASELAKRINPKWNSSNIAKMISELVEQGFINYYTDKEELEVKDKLIHYARAAQGKVDYDNLRIRSTTEKPNGILNAKKKETLVNEVPSVELSVKQKTGFKPTNNQITLLEDRDIRFGGNLFSGFAVFQGNKMHFDYEKFQVNLDSVRYLDFYVPTGDKDKEGNPVAGAINSSIEYVTGALLIDAPNNKSGKEDLKIFPSFQAKENSFIFYDKKETLGGAYKRDSFRFRLDPFPFNGLDSYVGEDLAFKGTMVSANIFTDFKETARLREDKSLGFVHRTPQEGYPTYSAKGKYTGEIDLSNKGFYGKGKLGYLTATVNSEDILFRPKQLTCTAKEFSMLEDRSSAVKTPQARGVNVSVNWLPYRDSMYVKSKEKAFELFKSPGYSLKGTLILTPSGLKANGEFDWAEGTLTSKLMAFGPFQTTADTCDLKIKALSGGAIAFDSRNMKGNLDFDTQKGDFKGNSERSITTLPFDKYYTNMTEFSWDMKAATVTFKSEAGKFGTFTSTDADRDSLTWAAKTAFYDLKTNELKGGGVNRIKSADAFIYPETGDVEVAPGGQMKTLKNARIVADTANQYHIITGATVDIFGKRVYKARGNYEYPIGSRAQVIDFQNIVGQTTGVGASGGKKNVLTTATGNIKEGTDFYMDTKVKFQGDVVLKANQKNLAFDGFGKFDTDQLPGNDWWVVNTEVDRTNANIRYRAPKNKSDDPLHVGIFLSKETGEMYPRIMLPLYARVDRPIIPCDDGVFKYEEASDKFIFGDSARVVGKSPVGHKMTFDNRNREVVGEGKIGIGSGLNYISVAAAGRLKSGYNTTDSTGFAMSGEIMSGVTFQLPGKLFEILLSDIRANTFDAADVPLAKEAAFYKIALPEFMAAPIDQQISINGLATNTLVMPKNENKFSVLFGKMGFRWNQEYQSFVSMDEKIPLLSINGEQVGKMVTGFVEYKMPANEDDRVYIYLKPNADQWYFFGYQGGVLNCVSSSTKFMDALIGMKAKEKIFKMPDGENYEVIDVTSGTAEAFINRAREGRK